jgi:hypothetical protein
MVGALPIGRGPLRNLGRALDSLAGNIRALESAENIFAEPNFPRFLYTFAGNMGWKSQARRNGLKIKQLYDKINPGS